jgi:hypothetical protein
MPLHLQPEARAASAYSRKSRIPPPTTPGLSRPGQFHPAAAGGH